MIGFSGFERVVRYRLSKAYFWASSYKHYARLSRREDALLEERVTGCS
jgi:hypothetical protein